MNDSKILVVTGAAGESARQRRSSPQRMDGQSAARASRRNYKGAGWTSVYLRKAHPHQFTALGLRSGILPAFASSPLALSGRSVRGGFALSDGDEWFIYGQRSPEGSIIELAVSPSRSPCSEHFASGLVQIARAAQLQLVDWYAGSVVDVSSPASVLTWARRYQRQ